MARVKVVVAGRQTEEEIYARDVQDLLNQLALPAGVEVRVIRGGQELTPDTPLEEGQRVTIVPVLRGGL